MLEPLAARLIWWQSAEESLRQPDRVIAQVMDIGDFDSVLRLRQVLGDPRLAAVDALPRLERCGQDQARSCSNNESSGSIRGLTTRTPRQLKPGWRSSVSSRRAPPSAATLSTRASQLAS